MAPEVVTQCKFNTGRSSCNDARISYGARQGGYTTEFHLPVSIINEMVYWEYF